MLIQLNASLSIWNEDDGFKEPIDDDYKLPWKSRQTISSLVAEQRNKMFFPSNLLGKGAWFIDCEVFHLLITSQVPAPFRQTMVSKAF